MSAPGTQGGVLESFRLDRRAALVTGAGSGLGFAFAEALAEAGANVACLDVHAGSVQHAADRVRELGRSSVACVADISDEAAVESAFEQAEQTLGPLHIVFANAGIAGEGGNLADSALADWQRVIDTDLTGTYLTVRAAARRMAPRGYGKLVTTGSLYSLRGDPLFGIHAYTAAKSGVVGLTRSAAISLGRHGVRINTIVPGYIHTQIAGGALYADDPESSALRQKVTDRTPLGRVGQPEELKGLAVFLAAPASDYCTGGIYAVDGGWLAT